MGHALRHPVTAAPDLRDGHLVHALTPPSTPAPGSLLDRVRRRLRTVDWLAPACALVALAVYTLRGFGDVLGRDLAIYAYGGQSVADGQLPYVAILNRAGPLAHLVPGIGAAAARVVGADDLLGMRVLFMLLSVAAVVAVYLVGRDLHRSRAAGVAAAAAMLSFQGFTVYATGGPREKTTMVLLLALALLATVHRRWFAAGAAVALATLTWQPVFLPAAAAVGVAALLGDGGPLVRVRALLRVAVGGAVPTLLTVLVYAAAGRLPLFLDDFWRINATWTEQTSLVDDPPVLWFSLSRAYGWSVWVLLLGLVAALVLGAVAVTRRTRGEARPAAQAGLALAVLAALAWSSAAFNGWPDAYVALPLAAVGVAGLVPPLARRVPVRVLTAAVTAWAVTATALSAAYCLSTRSDVVDVQRTEALGVIRHLPPHPGIVSISAPSVLVLLHRRNPSRIQVFGNGLTQYMNATWPGGVAGYGQWIERRAPELVLMGQRSTPPWIHRVLVASYVKVGTSHGRVRWFLRRDVAMHRRTAIEAVLARS